MRKASTNTLYLVCEREGSATRRSIPLAEELSGLLYLTGQYARLFLKPNYNVIFLSTRIAACVFKIIAAVVGATLWLGRSKVAKL
jgi:hypothetical protein